MGHGYFLPYQRRWLEDRSRIKVWEKSRRIGATYVQAFEDVRDCLSRRVPEVWFSSADESAAREYIEDAARWARMFDAAARVLGKVVLDSERDIKAYVIEFANGTRITALSSNPSAFRSKGGKVVLDEFAHHENAPRLWAAASPCITWGWPLRIISTHNGRDSLFMRFVEAIREGSLDWSLHTTDIHLALDEGLLEKIYGRPVTEREKKRWLAEIRANCYDEAMWEQEYLARAADDDSSFLGADLVRMAEREGILEGVAPPEGEDPARDYYVGMDVGRVRDLTVIWVVERRADVFVTRDVRAMSGATFASQRGELYALLSNPLVHRAAIDATGLGMQMAEEAQARFGAHRVEAVSFTAAVKEEIAYTLRKLMEEGRVVIPPDDAIRSDLRSVRRVTTAARHVRLDAAPSGAGRSHGDYFWALALALYAGHCIKPPLRVASRARRRSYHMLKGYYL